jgi:cation diffusion facilitator family transporter
LWKAADHLAGKNMAESSSKAVVYAALAGNFAIAVVKFGASWWSGSSAMLTEAIHSLVDTGNQGLLLFGMNRAGREPDESHPFGHGMELYFWSFVVALMIFLAGGAFSIYEGVQKFLHPEPISDAWVALAVLGISAVFEGASFWVALREFNARRREIPLLRAIRLSKDPSGFSVLLEDSAALAGLAVAAIGVAATTYLGVPQGDAVASVVIGLLLVAAAIVLARETRSLLTGESASPRVLGTVRRVLEGDPRVKNVYALQSIQLGPTKVLFAIALDIDDSLELDGFKALGAELRDRIKREAPIVSNVFFKLGAPEYEADADRGLRVDPIYSDEPAEVAAGAASGSAAL